MQRKLRDSVPVEVKVVPRALLKSLADDYLKVHRPGRIKGRAYFHDQPDLESAVRRAAGCIGPNGKRFDHQHRLREKTLIAATKRLMGRQSALRDSKTFDELMRQIEQALDGLSGAGELYRYDVALRISSKLDLRPEHVYLHAGTAKGASVFGFTRRDKRVAPSAFPAPFDSMPADELEDLLCIYKADLKAGKRLDKGGASNCDGARKTGSGSIQSTARSGGHW